MIYQNRTHAGRELAKELHKFRDSHDTVILALPRGGVPIASEIAKHLNLPFDILLVRKLGIPGQKEFAMGAIGEGNVIYINDAVVNNLHIPKQNIEQVIDLESKELKRRRELYRQGAPICELTNKTVIVVDDGLATGATMLAAIKTLNQQNIKCIIVAVPVCARSTCDEIATIADEVICLIKPDPFYGVGNWYIDFSQTTDQEVIELLKRTNQTT